jgi:hypothetical protein
MAREPTKDAAETLDPKARGRIESIVAADEITLLKLIRRFREKRPTSDLLRLTLDEQMELNVEITKAGVKEGDAYLAALQELIHDPRKYEGRARESANFFANEARTRWRRLTDGMAFETVTSNYDGEIEGVSCEAYYHVSVELRDRVERRALEMWERYSAVQADSDKTLADQQQLPYSVVEKSVNASAFWRDMEARFRALAESLGKLRADWDYIVGSGDAGTWRLGGAPPSGIVRFEALARKAGTALASPTISTPLVAWLDLLRRESPNLGFGPYGIETQENGEEGPHHQTGTVWRVCEASADQCCRLESEAFELGDAMRGVDASTPGHLREPAVANNKKVNPARPEEARRGKKPVRRNQKYKVIDEALQAIAESRPHTQEEVFQSLDRRNVVIPPAEPFVTARGSMAGFRRDAAGARAWLSKRWAELNLPSLPRGPKNSRK